MHPNSIWLIDIGNSSISVAQKVGLKLRRKAEFYDNQIPKLISFLYKSGGKRSLLALICSVVPKVESKIILRLKHYKMFNYMRLGREFPLKISTKYLNIKKLGNDRKLNVWGALHLKRPPFIVLDFGTATTIDYVSGNGVFEGGLILPGIKASLDLLHEKTALLPRVRIKPIPYFLGRDTVSGMLAGVLYGYGSMIRGLVREFRKRYGENLKTIGTGGLVDIVSRYCGGFDYVDPLLTLRSLGWVYEDWLRTQSKSF